MFGSKSKRRGLLPTLLFRPPMCLVKKKNKNSSQISTKTTKTTKYAICTVSLW